MCVLLHCQTDELIFLWIINSPQPHVQCCTTRQPALHRWPPGPEPVQMRTESYHTAGHRSSTGPGCCTTGSYTPPSVVGV